VSLWSFVFVPQATKNPFYLHVGREIIQSINAYTKTKCGYATVHDVIDMSLEDRMESFFLSETCKYLYLVGFSDFSIHFSNSNDLLLLILFQLFDVDNPLNKQFSKYLFTTEGHLLPIGSILREKPWKREEVSSARSHGPAFRKESFSVDAVNSPYVAREAPLVSKSNATQPSVSDEI